MESWVQKAIEQWQSEEVKLNPGATIEQIEQLERVLDFKFPDDFKQLYLAVNGFVDFVWMKNMFTIWPLGIILKEFEESRTKNFIGFADFLINSHTIGFYKGRDGYFKDYEIVTNGASIANSFKQVIELINSDSELIY